MECLGYQSPLTIVDERGKAERAVARSRISQQDARKTRGADRPAVAAIPTEMPIVAFRRNMFVSFLMDRLSDGRHKYGNSDWWILSAQDSQTPVMALDALTTRFFGQSHLQEDLVKEGTKLYVQTLKSLRNDLAGPEAFSLATLAATSTLSMFELVTLSTHYGWIQHAGGLARLMEARGPGKHKSQLERKVFLENRVLLASQAMVMRQRTFLAQEAWKSIPWEDSPETKDAFDYLMDIICDVPSIVEDTDLLSHSSSNMEGLRGEALFLDIAHRMDQALSELDAWWRGWATKNLDRVVERQPNSTDRVSYDEEGPLFHTVLFYESYWECYVTIFHNAVRVILLGIWQQLCNMSYAESHPVKTPNHEVNPLPLLGVSIDKRGLALEIFRSLEFCEHQSKKFMGTFCILFPILYAQQCLDPTSREGRWLLSLSTRSLVSFKAFTSDLRSAGGIPVKGLVCSGPKVMPNTQVLAQWTTPAQA